MPGEGHTESDSDKSLETSGGTSLGSTPVDRMASSTAVCCSGCAVAGTNAQERIVGLHHGDVTWKQRLTA